MMILVSLSVAVGWIAWSGPVLALPLAAFFPWLWSQARTRVQAAAVSMGYFLAASRGLPQGVANFYASNVSPGLALWLIASLAFVMVHFALWTNATGWQRPLRFLIASIAMSVPPVGILGWAHPITAAGVLFEGWHWWGLVGMIAGLAVMTTRHWRSAAFLLGGLWIFSASHWSNAGGVPGWEGVELHMGAGLGRDTSLVRQRELVALVRDPAHDRKSEGDNVMVLPESALGFWTPGLGHFWQQSLSGSGIVVIAGAAEIKPDGYDNVLVLISEERTEVLYRQRMPVPGAMWQPWRRLIGTAIGARAHIFANPRVRIGDRDIAILICYEQLIIWPVLQSMLFNVDAIIAVGNGWWTDDTSIIDVQRACTEAWARLFGKPLVMSFNQ
jgi:hypothetical protein